MSMFAHTSLRQLLCIVAILLPIYGGLYAQPETDDDDPYRFEDIPVDIVSSRYIAFGGGYLGTLVLPDYSAVNELATSINLPEMSGPFLLNGGGGFISLLFVPNLRLGIYGMGGSKTVRADMPASDGSPATVTRSLKLSQDVTAIQLDYAIRLNRNFTLLPGVLLGSNSFNIDVTQSVVGQTVGIINPSDTSASFSSHLATSGFNFLYYPALNLEWAPISLFMIRAGVGYMGTTGGEWSDNNDVIVAGVPQVKTDGLAIQVGAYFGFFQFR